MICESSSTTTGASPSPTGTCGAPGRPWLPGPPKLFLLALVSMVLLNLLAPLVEPADATLRWFGLLPLAAGVFLNLAADAAFKRAGTTVKPLLPSTALVTSGIFRMTRNPMYLGMALILLGLWLAMGTPTPALPAVAFMVAIDRFFVRPEEEKLAVAFGSAFASYRARVRRWI
jgi:protein-S-isoprenylcysteine O-methyltransferase Ste14